jgi:hypothetical protein
VVEVCIAHTAQEREAVARFRYEVYVQEMGRYRNRADHVGRRLTDPEDAWSWITYGVVDGQIVGTTRLTWGGAGFTERQISQYGLAPFLDELPAELLAVGERHMIAPGWRGSNLFHQLTARLHELTESRGLLVVFGACEPHLLSYYCRFQRPWGARNINSPDAGYLIPLVAFPRGPEALVDRGRHPGMPRCVHAVLSGASTVSSPLVGEPAAYWHHLRRCLTALQPPVFEGLADDELSECLAGSNIIRCAEGDRVITKDGPARNVYVVLAGVLEVNDGDHPIATLRPGDVFGETAYLLRGTRTQNVDVYSPDATILSLSEHTLRRLSIDHACAAAKLLENLSKILCRRLVGVR